MNRCNRNPFMHTPSTPRTPLHHPSAFIHLEQDAFNNRHQFAMISIVLLKYFVIQINTYIYREREYEWNGCCCWCRKKKIVEAGPNSSLKSLSFYHELHEPHKLL